MRRRRFRRIIERMCCSNHLDLAIGSESFDKLVDQARIDQWLVALDIDYVPELLCLSSNFGNAIGATAVPPRGQRDFRTPIRRGVRALHRVRRADGRMQVVSVSAALQQGEPK